MTAKHTPNQTVAACGCTVFGSMMMCPMHAAAPALLAALKALPLEYFGDDMSKCDAADFVDHAGEFFDAMLLAKAALKLAEGSEK